MQFNQIIVSYRQHSKYWSPVLNKFAEGGSSPEPDAARNANAICCKFTHVSWLCSPDERAETKHGGLRDCLIAEATESVTARRGLNQRGCSK